MLLLSEADIRQISSAYLSHLLMAILHPKEGHPSSGNVFFLAFDRVSAAWDNLGFWGYDEPSTD
jgi:hypothetical protein